MLFVNDSYLDIVLISGKWGKEVNQGEVLRGSLWASEREWRTSILGRCMTVQLFSSDSEVGEMQLYWDQTGK